MFKPLPQKEIDDILGLNSETLDPDIATAIVDRLIQHYEQEGLFELLEASPLFIKPESK